MRKLFSLAFIVVSLLRSSLGVCQNYWSDKAGGGAIDEALSVASDNAGNTYTVGYFTQTAHFNNGIILHSTGLSDVFVLKHDPMGNILWAKKLGGAMNERATSVACDGNGNVVITGHFNGTTQLGNNVFTSSGQEDVFVCKLDPQGNVLWAVSGGGTRADLGYHITVDQNQHILVTGQFYQQAQFANVTLNGIKEDVFLLKYDASGNLLWAKAGIGKFEDRGLSVTTDNQNNIYLSGKFSDTLLLDVMHPNTSFNASFIAKFNSNGQEQWFRKLGGGISCVAYDVFFYNQSLYITGDYRGTLVAEGGNVTLPNQYTHQCFLLAYNLQGTPLWGRFYGSESQITSRAVAANQSGVYTAGHFKCTATHFSNLYGSGVFNSVGYWDSYMTKYSLAGQFDWARHWGGKSDDHCWYLTSSGLNNEPVVCGSFKTNLNIPYIPWPSNNFQQLGNYSSTPYLQNDYCGSQVYGTFATYSAQGNYDCYVGRIINALRPVYDYYYRPLAGGCTRNIYSPELIPQQPLMFQNDTAYFCESGVLTWADYVNFNTVGPDVNFSVALPLSVGQSGNYSVIFSSVDGCYVWNDSVEVIVYPNPNQPLISDSLGINQQAINTQSIHICGDSVWVWGNTDNNSQFYWMNSFVNDSSLLVTVSNQGNLIYTVVNSHGCSSTNNINVKLDQPLDTFHLSLICLTDSDGNDTVSVCYSQDLVKFDIQDTILQITTFNPTHFGGYYQVYGPNSFFVTNSIHNNNTDISFSPSTSGWYYVQAYPKHYNLCDTIYYPLLYDSVFVEIHPLPFVSASLSAPISIGCPGDTVFISATYHPPSASISWLNLENEIQVNPTSVLATLPAEAQFGVSIIDSLGCMNNTMASITVNVPEQPLAFTQFEPAIICPFDSILVTCQSFIQAVSYQWYGPYGPIGGNAAQLYVHVAGFYYCVVTDILGCELYSNTVEIVEYSTPYITALPHPVLCSLQDSVELQVSSLPGSLIQWNSPIVSNSNSVFVSQPGTYTCEITLCGITTFSSVDILLSDLYIDLLNNDTSICQGDVIQLTAQTNGMGIVWYPLSTTQNPVSVATAGSFYAYSMDAWGCEVFSDTISIQLITTQASINLIPVNNYVCLGDSVIVVAETNPLGIPLTWQSNNTIIQIDNYSAWSYSPATIHINALYTDTTGCSFPLADSVTILYPPMPSWGINDLDTTICEGQFIELSVQHSIPITQVDWYLFDSLLTIHQPVIQVLDSGMYAAWITDQAGCTYYLDSLFVHFYSPPSMLLLTDLNLCGNNDFVELQVVNNDNVMIDVLWNPSIQNINNHYMISDTGTYECQIIYCQDTLFYSYHIGTYSVQANIIPGNLSLCLGDTAYLMIDQQGLSVQWNNGLISDTLQVFSTGNYFAVVTDSTGCIGFTDTISVEVYISNLSGIQNITQEFCAPDQLVFTINQPGLFYWYDDSLYFNLLHVGNVFTTPVLYHSQTYYVATFIDSCLSELTLVSAIEVPCDSMIIPNTMSVNGDGLNDYILFYLEGATDFRVNIFNRWGNEVYSSSDMLTPWYGTNQSGKKLTAGTYFYHISYTNFYGVPMLHQGFIQLFD